MQWIGDSAQRPSEGVMLEFMLEFNFQRTESVELAVTADQYYQLFLDERLAARRNEFGVPERWFTDSVTVEIAPGRHRFRAIVWVCGENSAMSMESCGLGFALAPASGFPHYSKLFSTAEAPWRVRRINSTTFTGHHIVANGWTGVPPPQRTDLRIAPGAWKIPDKISSMRNLVSGTLPLRGIAPQKKLKARIIYNSKSVDEAVPLSATDSMPAVFPLTIKPGESRRIVLYLNNYSCGYWQLPVSGGCGGQVKVSCAESLFDCPEGMRKSNRRTWRNKYFRGITDEFILGGGRAVLAPLAWRAGNFMGITVLNQDSPLTLDAPQWIESRHEFPVDGEVKLLDGDYRKLWKTALRTLQMVCHDNIFDCPYYEQLPYAGDGRIELLTSYVLSPDERLPRRMLELFAMSSRHNGLCMSRTPSREKQYIPSFSLWFVAMVYDYALYRTDFKFVRELLPATRTTLGVFLDEMEKHGLCPFFEHYWNFMDWVPSWRNINGYGGIPPGGSDGVSTVFNWLLAYVLKLAAKLEEHFGDASIARRYTGNAENLSVRLTRFMDAERGLYADDDSGGEFSEHAQIMAILAGAPNSGRIFSAMLKNPDVKRVSLFFTHYLFECAKLLEANALFHERLSPWFDALHMGFRTFPETFENSRSDCHGWGAMPLYHLISTVCGIRPAGFGFKNIEIAPLPDALGKLRSASCPHPAGKIRITAAGGELTVSLPKGTDGCFRYGGINMKLHPGTQQITIKEMKG